MLTRVLADANVLYSRTLRDWLALIELRQGPYKTYWSEDILAEVLYRLRRNNPTWSGARVTQVRDRIAGAFEGGRVDDFMVDGRFAGDPNDQHVHAAALACGAHILLTADHGFEEVDDADALPYEVFHPDEFFVLLDDSSPHVVRQVAQGQTAYFFKRHRSADLPRALRAAGCPSFAERVRRHLQVIDLRSVSRVEGRVGTQ